MMPWRANATDLGASAGRGAYHEALQTGQSSINAASGLNRVFNGERAEHFIFTLNCSDALNLAIRHSHHQLASHAICTHIDHNSIPAPGGGIGRSRRCDVTRVQIDPAAGWSIRRASEKPFVQTQS